MASAIRIGTTNRVVSVASPGVIAGNTTLKRGDILTIDGSTGQVLAGTVPMLRPVAYNFAPDIFSSLLVTAGIVALLYERPALSGLMLGCALWAKWTNAAFLPLPVLYLGVQRQYREVLRFGFVMYDALYAWIRSAQGESHSWPPKVTDGVWVIRVPFRAAETSIAVVGPVRWKLASVGISSAVI